MDMSGLRRVGGVLLIFALGLLLGATPLEAQRETSFTMQGRVLDASTQRPLPNVSVVLRGSGLGTLTDSQGRYTLIAKVPPGDYVLQYAVIGRREASRQVTLGEAGAVQLDPVLLEQSAVELEEIVVTGVGAPTEKRAIGNSVATVSGELINQAPAASTVDQALQGKIAGAVISENSGQPGGGVSIRLRGTSSILGGAEPLIVVDGVIIDNNAEALVGLGANAGRGGAALNNRLSDINPDDIERVEVIKGAAAAALYGSRANNGVIQIFTKRGAQGDPRFTLTSDLELSTTPNTYDFNMAPQAGLADVVFGPAERIGDPIQRFDVQDQIFRTGMGGRIGINMAGGSAGTSYYLSATMRDEQGILETTNYTKKSVQGKLTQQVTDWLEFTASGNFIQSHADFIPEGEQTFGVLTTLIFTPTSFNPNFDPEIGRFPFSPVLKFNALDVIENWQAPEDVTRFIGSFETTARPSDDFTIRYLFGFDDYRQDNEFFRPPLSQSLVDPGFIENPFRLSQQFNHDLTANWEARIGPVWSLTSTGGFRYTQDQAEITRAAAEGLAPGQTLVGGATQFASQSFSELRTVGGFLQERLAYDDRLFVTGGINIEAASAFGADQRWQAFPRLGVSWLVTEEPFWEGAGIRDWISTLRLRAAYGETGGQPPSTYLQATNYFGTPYSARPGFVASSVLGNPALSPERQREIEGGFELGLFDDRALIEITGYTQRTTDLVLTVPVPPSTGAQVRFENIGEVSNVGIEAALQTINLQRPNLTWRSRLMLSANRNEVVDMGIRGTDTLTFGYLNSVMEGQPVGVFYGRGFERDEAGEIVIDPATGLGARSPNRFIIGDPNPDLVVSLSNAFEVGESWSFDLLLDGRFGNDVANFTRRIQEFFGTARVVEEEIRRQVEGQAPLKYTLNAARISNYEAFIEDASFVKLREVALRYRVREDWARRLGAESVNLKLAGRNLYTWTGYTGLDPEVNLFSANTVARGVDFATTPIPRSVVFGVDLHF